ncbi:MAG: glycerol-3-phosphate acyltransferase [Actinomycetota bacterium]
MTLQDALWILGGYLAGTFPSTWLVSQALGATAVIRASHREASEADAHILLTRKVAGGWGVLAAIVDVAKGMALPLAARRWGHLPDAWVAMVGVAVVVGHAFPFYLRAMAGRGLAATAGVYLVLVPLPMVVAGVTMCAGIALRQSGLFSTVGFGSVPVVAWLQDQPTAYVAMAVAVSVLIAIRRTEGAGDVARGLGLPWWRAAAYKAVFDRGERPATADDRAQEEGPA